MKRISLTLRGFTGIQRGLGKDEITLDLSSLSGLVAIDGENGRGKTTMLDNLHPYRQLASRDGALQHHVYLRDSFKEFSFEYGGHHYRTLIKIDAQTGRQEGFVYMDGSTTSETTGKPTEYDKYVEDLLGTPKLFFHSIFAAQNGESIADMTEGDMKKLFSEFLQLDKLAEFAESAKQAGNSVQAQIEQIKQRVGIAEQQVAGKQEMEKQLSDQDMLLAIKQAEAEETAKRITVVSAELETAKEAAANHRAALQRKQELDREKQAIVKKAKELADARTGHEKQAGKKLEALKNAVAQKEKQLRGRNQLQGMKNELELLEKEIPEKERDIEKAQKEIDFAQKDIEDKGRALADHTTQANKSIEEQQSRIDDYTKKQNDLDRRLNEINSQVQTTERDNELTRLSYRIAELEKLAAKKDMLPAECNAAICPFIADARQAEKELPDTRKQHEARRAETDEQVRKLKNDIRQIKWEKTEVAQAIQHATDRKTQLSKELEAGRKAINAQIENLAESRDSAKETLQGLRKEIARLKERQKKLRSGIDNMPNFEAVESEISNYKDRISELEEEMVRAKAEHDRQAAELANRESETDKAIAALPLDPQAENLVKRKTDELDAAQKSQKAIEKAIADLTSETAVLQHRLQEIAATEKKIEADRKNINALSAELSEWRYIQQACGRNGLQALEIDGTAPMIAEYSNELLAETFGPGATVGFRTLDEEGRECLYIVVYREDDPDEAGTLLKNLSGGDRKSVV